MAPGSLQGLQLVVDDVEAAGDELSARALEVSDVQDFPWADSCSSAPDGNGWAVQQIARLRRRTHRARGLERQLGPLSHDSDGTALARQSRSSYHQ
jgi:hypothetical protein